MCDREWEGAPPDVQAAYMKAIEAKEKARQIQKEELDVHDFLYGDRYAGAGVGKSDVVRTKDERIHVAVEDYMSNTRASHEAIADAEADLAMYARVLIERLTDIQKEEQ